MSDKKILVVDDDENLCEVTAEILKDEGYSVEFTSDTKRAEELIDEGVFDIALFDYKMPHLTGADLLKKIKTKNPKTKVFIMSGRPFIEKVLKEEKVFDLVSGIIIKPFSDTTLLEKLKL
jgi:DNA-binding NtrC family response regulator